MGNKPLILLVEDEANIANFITAVLKANSYDVKRVAGGEEALMIASSYCPDLIILDLGLPDMDGQEVLGTLRTWMHTPVVVVSARSQERDKIEAFDLGADDYITKPFGTGELLARVRTCLLYTSRCVEETGGQRPVCSYCRRRTDSLHPRGRDQGRIPHVAPYSAGGDTVEGHLA